MIMKQSITELKEKLEEIKTTSCSLLSEVIFFDGVLSVIDAGKYLEKEKNISIEFAKHLLLMPNRDLESKEIEKHYDDFIND